MIRAVIFDLDDTLTKTYSIKWAQHKAVARDFYGKELTEEKIRKHWGKPFNTLVRELHDDADTIENMHQAYASTDHMFRKEIHDDALDVVHTLLERGIRIGVVTATNKAFVLRDLKYLGFPFEQFFHIQAADETEYHKPDPRVFAPTLSKLDAEGILKQETMYVGDAVTDLIAANGAGLHFIAITTGLNTAEDFQRAGARKTITRLKELIPLI